MAAGGASGGGGDVFERLFITDTSHSRILDYSDPVCFNPQSNFVVGIKQPSCPMIVPKNTGAQAAIRNQTTVSRQPVLQVDSDGQYYLDLNGATNPLMMTAFGGADVTFPGKKKIIITWGCRIEPDAINLNKFELHTKESFIGGITLLNNGTTNAILIVNPTGTGVTQDYGPRIYNASSIIPFNTKLAITVTLDMNFTNSRQRARLLINGVEHLPENTTQPAFTGNLTLGANGLLAAGLNFLGRSYFEAWSIVDWEAGDLEAINAWTMDRIKA